MDEELNREVVAKVYLGSVDRREGQGARARFIREVQVAAQLDHPGLAPVYDHGRLSDGRPYFLMRRIRGSVTLTRHFAGSPVDDQDLRRRISALVRACEAVAHAHRRSVIHRDLKPENVVVAEEGEVYVIDWGLARVGGESEIFVDGPWSPSDLTQLGTVAGSPHTMSPEAASGGFAELDARSDVYSLGAILYELLSGRRAYSGRSAEEIVRSVRTGPPPPPVDSAPADLEEIRQKAMSRDPEARHTTAEKLRAALQDWLDGTLRRQQALALVVQARERLLRAAAIQDESERQCARGEAMLAALSKWANIDERRPAWSTLKEAERTAREARDERTAGEQTLLAALELAPGLPEARDPLADHYGQLLLDARRAHRWDDAQVAEARLRTYGSARHASLLRRTATLSLETEPEAAAVTLYRFEEEDRQQVPKLVGSLGATPIIATELPHGSYLLIIEAPGYEVVRYPFLLDIDHAWHGCPPGEGRPAKVRLPPVGSLAPWERFVPEGWYEAGDPQARGGLPRMPIWVDAFSILANPVTNRQYLRFLNALVDEGRVEEALSYAPRELGRHRERPGPPVYGQREDGHFELVPDADDDLWDPEWPVVLVDWACVVAYAAWFSRVTGHLWRAPLEAEWEKAARGVDGRIFPWGDAEETIFACVAGSRPGKARPACVGDFETDTSVYGVRHLAGNVRDWCLDLFEQPNLRPGCRAQLDPVLLGDLDGYRVARGGCWNGSTAYSRTGYRLGLPPHSRLGLVGFRLVRSDF